MYIELFKARKSLYNIIKLKNYIILDMEFARINDADQKQYVVNIAAKYYKDNVTKKEYNVWKMPNNATNKALEQLAVNKHQLSSNLKSKNGDEYNQIFIGFYRWLSDNSLTKTPIIGWGIDEDLKQVNTFFNKNINVKESSRPMFEYDLQDSFTNHIDMTGMSLQVVSNLLGISEDNHHIGIDDVDLINTVKGKIELLVKTFNL